MLFEGHVADWFLEYHLSRGASIIVGQIVGKPLEIKSEVSRSRKLHPRKERIIQRLLPRHKSPYTFSENLYLTEHLWITLERRVLV